MTRIDFYLNATSKLHVACKITSKAVHRQMRVLIIAPDDLVAREIDRLMWTISATGFLPHCMSSDSLAQDTPVLIARNADTLHHDEVLLNLGLQPPASFSRFKRMVEIVSGSDEADKQAARERFRFYKDRGYELHHHDLAHTGEMAHDE